MIDLLHTRTETTQRTQGEFVGQFEHIIRHLLELNGEVDALTAEIEARTEQPDMFEQDLQAERLAGLTALRDELLAEIFREPAKAFEKEFDELGRLYTGRTRTSHSDGMTIKQFVTRDPARMKADLHFVERDHSDGSIERIVEVPATHAEDTSFYVSLKDEELRLATSVYSHGKSSQAEVEPESPEGMQLLSKFFTHTIIASDLMYNRTPDEIKDADLQAKQFLQNKLTSLHSY